MDGLAFLECNLVWIWPSTRDLTVTALVAWTVPRPSMNTGTSRLPTTSTCTGGATNVDAARDTSRGRMPGAP